MANNQFIKPLAATNKLVVITTLIATIKYIIKEDIGFTTVITITAIAIMWLSTDITVIVKD